MNINVGNSLKPRMFRVSILVSSFKSIYLFTKLCLYEQMSAPRNIHFAPNLKPYFCFVFLFLGNCLFNDASLIQKNSNSNVNKVSR